LGEAIEVTERIGAHQHGRHLQLSNLMSDVSKRMPVGIDLI
jgi:hypothetical protein